jgi:uncharacterized peroxidase-related enzyme
VRLEGPSREHRLRERVIQRLVRLRLDAVPDVVLACQHRPEFFGKPFLAWIEASLRGPSQWTQGDRELMAALVSDRNRCAFCVGTHSATATSLVGDETVHAVLRADHGGAENGEANGAGISVQLRATLAFVEKLTLSPGEVGASDVERAVAAGVSHQALIDAVEVCAAFNVMNRVADALAFEPQDERSLAVTSKVLTTRGYRA